MYVVSLNLIQLLSIGLLYLELSGSNGVRVVNDHEMTSNGLLTGKMTLTTHPLVPARYFQVSYKYATLGIGVSSATELEERDIFLKILFIHVLLQL